MRSKDLARVPVDATVQPKNITFPTDAKLLHAAIKALNRLASKHDVRPRQSYVRVARHAAKMGEAMPCHSTAIVDNWAPCAAGLAA